MKDPFNLQRFVDAQSGVIDQVCSELRAGRKRSHWMWYIFPQITGSAVVRRRKSLPSLRWRKLPPISTILCSGQGSEHAPSW